MSGHGSGRLRFAPAQRLGSAVGLGVTAALHVLLFLAATGLLATGHGEPPAAAPLVIALQLLPAPPDTAMPEPGPTPPPPAPPAAPVQAQAWPETAAAPAAVPDTPRPPATMAAPPAPSAQEWAFASTYTLKNSKAYRYTWGQQVRSTMGTAVEGIDQGTVRFRVEIAPDGSLTRLDTLWATSPAVERLARRAVAAMPRWPATPTGKPLVFEKTLSFTPFASDDPPLYKDDCLPDPPAFSNPFSWDGQSPRKAAPAQPAEKPDPQALQDCLRQLPPDTAEAEAARDRRAMERWGWSR